MPKDPKAHTVAALRQIAEFFSDEMIDDDWWQDKASIKIDGRNITITVDDVNCQELKWIQDALAGVSSEHEQ